MASHSEAVPQAAPAVEVRRLGKYELQKQLGAGGMGTVFLAKDTQLKRLVALKILSRDKASNPTLVKRFQAEAQAAAQLRHDNIVAIYENGEVDGHLFIAMEYVNGDDVQELIRKRGKIPVKRALEIVKEVALALKHAHENHIVHRDIKPSNLLVRTDGVVKVTDLGLARSVDDTLETDITRAGTTVGTIDYMSPEQARNSKLADIRSDIYSLGCTWYHMLTGQPPFPEGSMTNKLQAHATKPPPDPRYENDTVTETTVAILQRMLAKRPEDRYQTPDELLADLGSRSLTRGGHKEEVYSAISEKDGPAETMRPAKRGLTGGALPPKQKVAFERDDNESRFRWEAIQPYFWGGLGLSVTLALALLVASYSGTLDFGSDPLQPPQNQALDSLSTEPSAVIGGQDGSAVPGQATAHSVNSETPKATSIAGKSQPSDGADEIQVNSPDEATLQSTTVQSSPVGDSPGTLPKAVMGNGNPAGSQNNTSSLPSVTNPSIPSRTTGLVSPSKNPMAGTIDPESLPTWSTTAGEGGEQDGAKSPSGRTVAGKVNPGPAVKTLTVGVGDQTASHFPLLSDALRAVPAEGAVLRLTGAGPYELPLVQVSNVKFLVCTAAEGQQPVVVVRPAAGAASAGLELTGGVLDIEGLHFVVDRSAFAGSDPVKIVSVMDGQLTVRRSTFSLWGNGSAPVAALHFGSLTEAAGQPALLEPRMLAEQVFVRGDQLTSLAISRPSADVVVRDSLLIGGTAPVVQISGKLPEQQAKSQSGKPRRAVRLAQSTLFGQHTVFQLSDDGAEQPPITAISLLESVCATSAPKGSSRLLDATSWSSTPTAGTTGKLTNLTWLMKHSVATGFGKLADLNSDGSQPIIDVDAWQTLWNQKFTPAQFPSQTWPAGPLTEFSLLRPADFQRDSLPAKDVLRVDDSPPGCETALLAEPAPMSLNRLAALAAKPQFPAAFAAVGQTVSIDVSKQDLGRELQNGTWPAGTVIEVTGVGLRPMSPVMLTEKSWKVVWRSQSGAPLTLTPKPVATELDGLIVVNGGAMEFSNLRFQVSATKKSALKSLFICREASLTLDNVDLQGVLTDAEVLDSLLQWSGGSVRADGTAAVLACRDSLFLGSGRAVRLELGAGPALFRNCLLACRGDCLDVRLTSVAPSGALLADHVTFSATMGAIHVSHDGNDQNRPPHRFYFDECAFVPPLSSRSEPQAPTLFSTADPNGELYSIEWWGRSNGVSPDVPSFIRSARDLSPQPTVTGLTRWQSAWREEQDLRLLTGAGGVVMAESLSNQIGAVKPSHFALHPSCEAAHWGDGEQPIGADLRRLQPGSAAAKPKDQGKTPVKKPVNKGPSAPDF